MPISTHVLDTSLGRPASGVQISLTRFDSDHWHQLGSGSTDADGRWRDILPPSLVLTPGVYRIRFEVQTYFDRIGVTGLYPFVEIAFHVAAGQNHYHIPLLLNPHGYTTYRGS